MYGPTCWQLRKHGVAQLSCEDGFAGGRWQSTSPLVSSSKTITDYHSPMQRL